MEEKARGLQAFSVLSLQPLCKSKIILKYKPIRRERAAQAHNHSSFGSQNHFVLEDFRFLLSSAASGTLPTESPAPPAQVVRDWLGQAGAQPISQVLLWGTQGAGSPLPPPQLGQTVFQSRQRFTAKWGGRRRDFPDAPALTHVQPPPLSTSPPEWDSQYS